MWRDAGLILLSPKPGDEGLTHLLGQLCFIFSPCLLSMLEDKGLWPSHLILGDLVQVTSLGSMTPSSARGEMWALYIYKIWTHLPPVSFTDKVS